MNKLIEAPEGLFSKIIDYDPNGILIIDLEEKRILFANPAAARMHACGQQDLVGLKMERMIDPQSWNLFGNFVELIQQGSTFEVRAQHMCFDDSFLVVEWRAVPFEENGKTCAMAILSDATKRIQEEFAIEQNASMHVQELAILLEISRSLAATLEITPPLILKHLHTLIKYSYGARFMLEGSSMVAVAAYGSERMEELIPFRFEIEIKKTFETLLNEHKPILIKDIWNNDPSAVFMRTLLEKDSAPMLEGMQSGLWLPLVNENRIIGGFGLTHEERNFFTQHQAELAMTIANMAAVTLANAESFKNAQSLAALQERQRLAQNLHDAVNQSLFSAGLIAEVLPRLWEKDQNDARKSLDDLRRLTRGAQAEMRALLVELRPSTLTDADLGDLLRLLGNAFAGRTNIPVTVTITGEGRMQPEVQVVLYRLCDEALANIAKHAKATAVDLKMIVKADYVDLFIRDDGVGFDASKLITRAHFGLSMMRERAESVGAELKISSKPGRGTKISIHWRQKEVA